MAEAHRGRVLFSGRGIGRRLTRTNTDKKLTGVKTMKKILAIIVLAVCGLLAAPMSSAAQAKNHGITILGISDASAASCTAATVAANGYTCVATYLVFEGASSANENMTTPFGTFTAAPWDDNGPTMNSYLGTTRCYVFQFQEVLTYSGGSTLTIGSANSTEYCFSFPSAPAAPTTSASQITVH